MYTHVSGSEFGAFGTYSLDRASSKTSIRCSTRLFAVRSSLPTVTLTGFCWNVVAKRRTDSGHVALTVQGSTQCKTANSNSLTHHGLSLS